MSTLLIIATAVLVLALVLGGAVVLLGAALLAILLIRRRRGAEPGAEAAPDPVPGSQASPVPLTRLVSADGALRPAPASPTPPPPPDPRPVTPTIAPEDSTEQLGNLRELFDRLERASEEDSTELLSREERVRLYGFDIGSEERPAKADLAVDDHD